MTHCVGVIGSIKQMLPLPFRTQYYRCQQNQDRGTQPPHMDHPCDKYDPKQEPMAGVDPVSSVVDFNIHCKGSNDVLVESMLEISHEHSPHLRKEKVEEQDPQLSGPGRNRQPKPEIIERSSLAEVNQGNRE